MRSQRRNADHRSHVGRWIAIAGCVSALSACDRDRGGEFGTDGDDPTRSLVQPVLELTIGDRADTARQYQFASIISVLHAADGVIWVVDGDAMSDKPQSPLIRQFDSTGRFLRQVGRVGTGPGEYRSPDGLALMPDGRVAMRDPSIPDRITIYNADGSLGVVWSLGAVVRWGYNTGYPIGVDTAGSMWLPFIGRPGPQRTPIRFVRLRGDGSVLDTVPFPTLPNVEPTTVRVTRTSPGGSVSVRGVSVPYSPSAVWAWAPAGRFAVARTDTFRIAFLPPPTGDGPGPVAPLETFERHIEGVDVMDPERRAARERIVAEIAAIGGAAGTPVPEIPRRKPFIKGIRFSEDGFLWVSVSMPSVLTNGEWSEPIAYDIFDRERRLMGRVAMPSSFVLFGMRGDRMWGVSRDGDGIESVRMYRIPWR